MRGGSSMSIASGPEAPRGVAGRWAATGFATGCVAVTGVAGLIGQWNSNNQKRVP